MNCKNCSGKLTKTKEGTYKCVSCNAVYLYEGGELTKARICKNCSAILKREGDRYICLGCGKKYNVVKPRPVETPTTPDYTLLDKNLVEEKVEVYVEKCTCGCAVSRIKKTNRFKCVACKKEYMDTEFIYSVPKSKASPDQIEKAIEIRKRDLSKNPEKGKKSKSGKTSDTLSSAFLPSGTASSGYTPKVRDIEKDKKTKNKSPRISGATSSGKSGIVLGIIFTIISVLLIAFRAISLFLGDKIGFVASNKELVDGIFTIAIPLVIIIYLICASITGRKTLSGLGLGLFVLVNVTFTVFGLKEICNALTVFGLPSAAVEAFLDLPVVSQLVGFDGYKVIIVGAVGLALILLVMIGSKRFEKKGSLIAFGIFTFLGCALFTILNCSYLDSFVSGLLSRLDNPMIDNLFVCLPSILGALGLISLCGFMAEHDTI